MAKLEEALKLFKEKQSLDEVINTLKNQPKLPGPVSDPLQDADIFPYQPGPARQRMEQNMGGPLATAEASEEPETPNFPESSEVEAFYNEQQREPAGFGEIEQEDEVAPSAPRKMMQQMPKPEMSQLEQNMGDIQAKVQEQQETPEQKALRFAEENRVSAAIQRATSNVGEALASAGIGRKIELDKEGQKLLEQGIDRPAEILKFQQEQEKIKRDLQNAGKMADPNSDISKLTRSMLGQVGLSSMASSNMSAQDLKNAGIDVDTLLSRKIQMDQTRAMREQTMSMRENARVSDMAARLAPKVQNNQYEKMVTLNSQLDLIKNAVENPNPQNDSAIIYAFVKALDPESVVREGEITFVQAARSVPSKMKALLSRAVDGQTLTPTERQNIFNFAQNAANLQQKAWKASAAPYLEQARKMNIPEEMIVPGVKMNEPAPENAAKADKNLPPTITIRRKADGKEKTLRATDAEKYLRSDEYERVR